LQMSSTKDLSGPTSLWQIAKDDPKQIIVLVISVIVIISVRVYMRTRMNRKRASVVGKLTEINIYPIKGCHRISLQTCVVSKFGLVNDRRWMLVDNESYRFVTQRTLPRMAVIQPSFSGNYMFLDAPGMPTFRIPLSGADQKQEPIHQVGIWDSPLCPAIDEGDEAASWFNKFLNTNNLRLVRMPDDHQRSVPPKFMQRNAQNLVSFADAFPFLLISEVSLAKLNANIAENAAKSGKERGANGVPMTRFRPNFVITAGNTPFIEDTWNRFKIGDIFFRTTKKCSRCKVPTIDQESGVSGDKEPTQTLETFRKGLMPTRDFRQELVKAAKDQVFFGQNLIHENLGQISVGQPVVVFNT